MSGTEVLGRVAAKLLELELHEAAETSETPLIRVRNYEPEEVEAIVSNLAGMTLPGREDPVKVIVAARSQPPEYLADLEPPQERLGEDTTLTVFRNQLSPDGQIFIEIGTQPDAETLRSLFPFTESQLLSFAEPQSDTEQFLKAVGKRVELFVDHAWNIHNGGAQPAQLATRLSQILKSILDQDTVPAVRPWAAFVDHSVRNLVQEEGPWNDESVQVAIRGALPSLRLFADQLIFDNPPKRLLANVRVARRQKPNNGNHIDDKTLLQFVTHTEFRDLAGHPLPEGQSALLRTGMREFISGYGESNPERYAAIELQYWLQLFDKEKTQTRRLGDRVYEHIRTQQLDRVDELEELNVVDGLNERETEAAEKIIDHEAPIGQDTPLFGLLTPKLRREIEKLAQTARTVRDPLIGALRNIYPLTQELTGDETLKISAFGLRETTVFTRRLFALLYGRTLRQIVEASHDSVGIRLSVDDDLLELGEFTREDEGEEGEKSPAGGREALDLRLTLDGKTVATLRWDAKALQLFSLGRSITESVLSGEVRIESLSKFEELAISSDTSLPDGAPLGSHRLVESWAERRASDFQRFKTEGIDAEALIDHAHAYGEILAQARSEMIPQGAALPDLQDLLSIDTAVLDGDRTAVLGTHPIRLRWLGKKLQRVRDDLINVLCGELVLNPHNEDLYFDWLEDLTPHQQPSAMTARGASVFNVASGEVGLGQEYRPMAPMASTGRRRWAAGIDDVALNVVVRQAERYMAAFPHKGDGLSLLVVPPAGDTELPARLVRKIQERLGSSTVLKVHVAAPPPDHARITISLGENEVNSDSTDAAKATSLMPLFQVSMHDIEEFETESGGSFGDLTDQIDIAVVPDLFSTDVTVDEQTCPQEPHHVGSFDPLLGRPIRRRDDGPTGKESVLEFLPTRPDPILEAWSTLTVYQKRWTPVGYDPANIDYLIVRVELGDREEQFIKLHSYAHWVVTVDQLVGRNQIDAMDADIDVIHVEEGVGTNKAHCLVVSSNSGKEFVQRRFATKLCDDLKIIDDETQALDISGHLFETGRDIAPRVLLEALGLGRTAEEIIGLTIFRHRALEEFPVEQEGTVEVYLNLDDLTHWFGGHLQRRADVLRLTIRPGPDGGSIEMLVCESKYRRSEDNRVAGQAKIQVEDTIDLLRAGFCHQETGEAAADRDIWYHSLASAVLQVAKKPSDRHKRFPAYREHPGSITTDRHRMIEDIAHGRLKVTAIEGAIFLTTSTDDGENEVEAPPDEPKIVRTRRTGLRRALQGLGELVPTDEPTDEPTRVSEIGMATTELQEAYQKMFDTFGALGVSVEKPDADSAPLYEQGPAFYTLRVKPAEGVLSSAVTGKVRELKLKLALSRKQEIRYYTDRGAVVFQIPKSDEQRYYVDAEELWKRTNWPTEELYAPLGEDISGRVVGINFSSSTSPHLLIGGTTGGGKSVALETILRGLCAHYDEEQLRLDLVDGKGTELVDFDNDPHLNGTTGLDWEDAVEIVKQLVVEMQDRYKTFRTQKAKSLTDYNKAIPGDQRKPWRVLVLDEYTDLVEEAGSKNRQQLESPLIRLTSKGRAAGIHVIVSTQKPSADVLKTGIRSNLPAQLALRVKTNTDSRIIMGEAGAETLAGNGDALLRLSADVMRIQCAMYSGSSH